MGIELNHGGGEYSTPKWKVIRKSIYEEESGKHRLWGGMNGEIIINKSWGDVVVRTTMGERGSPDEKILLSMLEYEVPQAEQARAGELKAPGIVVYWRVGPSPQQGKLSMVLARKCERESGFDNLVSFSSHYPGNVEKEKDVSSALREVNQLVRCLRN